ncbi:MAG: hypothetical protein R6V76_00315 [Desulfobacterales bacterium]
MGFRFSDLIVPRHMHKNPELRKEGAAMLKDTAVLAKMAEIDVDEGVRQAAAKRLAELKDMKGS